MSSNDLLELYSEKILQFASEISLIDRIESPSITITKRSPLCGSMITIDLIIKKNRVFRFGQDVKACALGQASASIFAKKILDLNINKIFKVRDEVLEMLEKKDTKISPPFEDYNYLYLAKDYKNRHASIMLVLEATVEGLKRLKEKNQL